jgi:bifunctional DNA-binding transcriptional regulator/antitoxin component of YhaV-PrlF toxin-antitoxin module
MKVAVRRIGNSLGVILPKPTLDAWGVAEGDELELTERGLYPQKSGGFSHQELDQLKLAISFAVVRYRTPREIRAKSLANLHRWKQQGTWVSAYDEWREIIDSNDDGRLYAAMLGRDEDSTRLRQSMPYVGLLPQPELRKLYEEAGS